MVFFQITAITPTFCKKRQLVLTHLTSSFSSARMKSPVLWASSFALLMG